MAEKTTISWCDMTFNPWSGCSKISEGCRFCYAAVNYSVKMRGVKWGPNGNRIVAAESMWKQPLKWNREACEAGERKRVFCASLADVFEDWTGPMLDAKGERLGEQRRGPAYGEGTGFIPLTMQDVRNRLFRLIDATPNLMWMVLTKRPENIARMMPPAKCPICRGRGGWETGPHSGTCRCNGGAFIRPNLMLGTSVEDQQTADERIPHLLRVPAAVRFLSVEPLLGEINLEPFLQYPPFHEHYKMTFGLNDWRGIEWVICGGESGPGARPCDIAWIRSIVAQCKAAGVACFVKQLGAHPIQVDRVNTVSGTRGNPEGVRLKDKKGGSPGEWPEDLRVRELPEPNR